MTTCSHSDPADLPEFLCRKCHPELNKRDTSPTTTAMKFAEPPIPRDRYGHQLAKGVTPEVLAALLAEQDIEIAAKKASDQARFVTMRAEAAEQKAAGIKTPKRRVARRGA